MPSRKNKKTDPITKHSPLARILLDTMKQAGRPLFLHEMVKLAALDSKARKKVMEEALKLCQSGEFVELKGGRFGLTEMMHLIKGRLSMHRDGYGFVTPEGQQGAEDIFIARNNLKGAVHGDIVMVRVEPSKTRTRRIEGSVLRLIERSLKKVIGTFHKGKSVSVVKPEDERLLFEIIIPKKNAIKAQTGQIVLAEITDFDLSSSAPEGRIIEILGDENDLSVQARIVAYRHELPQQFSDATLKETELLPDEVIISEKDISEQGRKDLRDVPLITIDGETAKDFDDAVWAKKTRTGYELLVAIADVSHYVQIDSPIDKDAMDRGTSVYFSNSVVPMLPEALSNNLCSLVPDKDRLAVVAEIHFDRQGHRKKAKFYPAVIKNHRRCTYSEIAKLIEQLKSKAKTGHTSLSQTFLKPLNDMTELAMLLTQVRQERGSIDFDLPEPFVVIGITGELEDIVKRQRNFAHQLIEEFMLAANEAVADFFVSRSIPALFRIHEQPDPQKLDDFREFAESIGLHLEKTDGIDPAWCQKAIKKAANEPFEYLVNTVLLRSMRQAVYTPDNKGHFGLASQNYLHFTSPIRRYPDLVTHRILKANMKKRKAVEAYPYETLARLGTDCSRRERVAIEAEREMLERLKARFMAEKVGEIFDGIISGVASFGFFVELKDIFVEGAVRMVDLADDYYECDLQRHRLIGQRTRKIYQLGMPVTVRLKSVNITRRHLNFEIVEKSTASSDDAIPHKETAHEKRTGTVHKTKKH